jgi:hypothetical protein
MRIVQGLAVGDDGLTHHDWHVLLGLALTWGSPVRCVDGWPREPGSTLRSPWLRRA